MTKSKLLILFPFLMQVIYSQSVHETIPPAYIKTIIFKGGTPESQFPMIRMNETLSLRFDVLGSEEPNFYYTIEHCNRDWSVSTLFKSEYLKGMDNLPIRAEQTSFNTYQTYSHYQLQLPNEQTKGFLVSGNYSVNIFDDQDNFVFSRKFLVYEEKVKVGVEIKRSRDVWFIDEKQTVDVKVFFSAFVLNNPTQLVKTVIVQNDNFKTAKTLTKPQFIQGNTLIYKHSEESGFWAGNEYLYFENKNLRSTGNNVRSINLESLYHVNLFTDQSRKNKPYTYNPDINGRFLITSDNANNVNVEADYCWVHFSLHTSQLTDRALYVYGGFNNYALEESNRMMYDSISGVYHKAILLKQGFYNYKYVGLDKEDFLYEGLISGHFFQTENNYKVLVYYRDWGGRYDRIVGLGEGRSRP